MQEAQESDMSTTTPLLPPPLRQNNRGATVGGSSPATTTKTTTLLMAAAPSSSVTDSPNNIDINNSFTDSAIDMDMDTSSGNITQTPDPTTTMTATTPPPQKSTTRTIITQRLLRLARLLADPNSKSDDNISNNNNINNNNNNNNHNHNNDNKSNNNQTCPHMSPRSPRSPSLSVQKSIAIVQYLDGIEGLLLDPYDDEVRVGGEGENKEEEDEEEEGDETEIGTTKSSASDLRMDEKYDENTNHTISASPSYSNHLLAPSSSVSRLELDIEFQNGKDRSQTQRHGHRHDHGQVDHNELDILLRDLKIVTRCLEQRRTECLHLNAVFTVKCEKLAQRILEMEDEIDELRAEKIESTIELEGLKGTVRGLEGWIRRWKKKQQERRKELDVDVYSEYTSSSEYSSSDRGGGGEWDYRNQGTLVGLVGDSRKDDVDTLMDGISTWLHSWSEVEEGFRIRARLRKQRVAIRLNRGG